MAVSSRSSRRIIVDEVEFRWRAAGHDFGISVALWPVCNDHSRVHGVVGYHQTQVENSMGGYSLQNQVVVTNRLIRKLILHYGVETLTNNNRGQINAGNLEELIDLSDAVRAEDPKLPHNNALEQTGESQSSDVADSA